MIRVLRLLEYQFVNYEEAQRHLGQCSVPNDGTPRSFGGTNQPQTVIRSVIITTPWSVTPDVKSSRGRDND